MRTKRWIAYKLLLMLERLPFQPFCSYLATYLVVSDPELVASLRKAVQDMAEGRILTHEEVFGKNDNRNQAIRR